MSEPANDRPDAPTPDETRVSAWVVTHDTVFPNQTNPLGTLFGGRVLQLMDVNASIDFRNPIHVGEIIEVRSRVAWVGTTSMIVRCEVHGENPLTGERRLCTIGHLNFVAIGDDGKPTAVPRLRVDTDEERRHWTTGQRVRDDIQRRRLASSQHPSTPSSGSPPADA